MAKQSISWRLSFYYLALFLIVGIFVPYLPLWMSGRGLSNEQIGLVLAAALWAKIPVGLMMAGEVDQSGKRWRALIFIAVITLAALIVMEYADSFLTVLLIWMVIGTLLTTAMPIADSLSMLAANRSGINYGQVRRWGSISFVLASFLGGLYLEGRASDQVLWLMMGGAVLLVVATWTLPDLRTNPRQSSRSVFLDVLRGFLKVLKTRNFLLFVITAGILQSSHAGLYGFSARHWTDSGLSSTIVGMLWAEGVVAEVIVFSVSGFLLAKLGPARLLMLAGAAGLVRWGVISQTTELPILIAVQTLHGLTFSGTHIAAFGFIQKNVSENQSGSAQGLYDSLAMGLFFGLSMAAAGWIYERATSDVWLMMAALSLVGGLGAILLYFRTKETKGN